MKTRNSHGLLQLGREALAYCQCASALISGNKALFVSVDLIGEKNQVILELTLMTFQLRREWKYGAYIFAFFGLAKPAYYITEVVRVSQL